MNMENRKAGSWFYPIKQPSYSRQSHQKDAIRIISEMRATRYENKNFYLARFMPERAKSPSREARVTTPSPYLSRRASRAAVSFSSRESR